MLILPTMPKPDPTARALTSLEVLSVQDPRICLLWLAWLNVPSAQREGLVFVSFIQINISAVEDTVSTLQI